MIKLVNEQEHDDIVIYVSMMPYYLAKSYLSEDAINADDVIKKYKGYEDPVDTRNNLLKFIQPIADELAMLDFIDKCEVTSSPERIKKSLSNYITIYFCHPDKVSESEIEKVYAYVIRFSDHENMHPEKGTPKEVPIVGMKPKNLRKAAMKIFKSNLSAVESGIRKFEIEKFGKQLTFFNNKED